MMPPPTKDDEELLTELEGCFGAYSQVPGEICDAEMTVVARCDDPRVADLIMRLLNAFWEEYRETLYQREQP